MFDFLLKINDKEEPKLSDHLTQICLSDESGFTDDELSLSFVYDASLSLPKIDDAIALAFGPSKELIEWRSYKITEIEISESILNIRAYASAGIAELKIVRLVHWKITIAAIVHKIAKRAGCDCVVDERFLKDEIKIVQDESDLSFLHRLASKYSAILKINDKKIVFVSLSYQGLARFKLELLFPYRWQKRKKVTGVKAFYWNEEKKRQAHIIVGDDEMLASLPGSYASLKKAKERASARLMELKRQDEILHITIPCSKEFNTAKISSGSEFDVSGYSHFIDGLWFVKRVEHRMSPHQGLEAEIELLKLGV